MDSSCHFFQWLRERMAVSCDVIKSFQHVVSYWERCCRGQAMPTMSLRWAFSLRISTDLGAFTESIVSWSTAEKGIYILCHCLSRHFIHKILTTYCIAFMVSLALQWKLNTCKFLVCLIVELLENQKSWVRVHSQSQSTCVFHHNYKKGPIVTNYYTLNEKYSPKKVLGNYLWYASKWL